MAAFGLGLALFLFAACSNEAETPADTAENQGQTQNQTGNQTQDNSATASQSPVRGVWNGNVFTSEHLGFTFTMPAS